MGVYEKPDRLVEVAEIYESSESVPTFWFNQRVYQALENTLLIGGAEHSPEVLQLYWRLAQQRIRTLVGEDKKQHLQQVLEVLSSASATSNINNRWQYNCLTLAQIVLIQLKRLCNSEPERQALRGFELELTTLIRLLA